MEEFNISERDYVQNGTTDFQESSGDNNPALHCLGCRKRFRNWSFECFKKSSQLFNIILNW